MNNTNLSRCCLRSVATLVHFSMVLFLCLGSVGGSQAATVTGTVYAKDSGKPLRGVNLVMGKSHLGASTDSLGKFTIVNVPEGRYRLKVSHLGYRTHRETVFSSQDGVMYLEIALSPEPLSSDEVVFTATRTWKLLKDVPVATELIKAGEIRERAASTAADALQSEVGIDISENFSGKGVSIQGVDPDKVLVLIDGERVIGRVQGSIDLDQISTAGIKQIEVVKGAVSTLYGSEAIGGVINIITEEPKKLFRVTLDMNYGGWSPGNSIKGLDPIMASTTSVRSNTIEMKSGKLGLRHSIQFKHQGEIDLDPSTEHTNGIEKTDRWNQELKGSYHFSDAVTLKLSGRIMDEEKQWVEDDDITSVDVHYDDFELNDRKDISATILLQQDWRHRLQIRGYRSENSHTWRKLTRPSRRVKDMSRNDERFSELSLQLDHFLGKKHNLTFGADLYRWDIDTETRSLDTLTTSTSSLHVWDVFLQNDWQMSDHWSFLPGIRYEKHEVYNDHWSPSVSFMWSPGDIIKVRASAGLGYRAPSSKELYFVFNHAAAGYIVEGNPDLAPETSQNYSINLEHTYKNSSVARISLFYNQLENLIDFLKVNETPLFYRGIYRYMNIKKAYTRGVEVERGFKIGSNFLLKLGYSYLETRDQETGRPLFHRPRHTGSWHLNWNRASFSTRLWGSYYSRNLFESAEELDQQTGSVISENENWAPSYTTWNLAVSYQVNPMITTYLKCTNLLNYTHIIFGPWSGRVILAGFRWSYEQ